MDGGDPNTPRRDGGKRGCLGRLSGMSFVWAAGLGGERGAQAAHGLQWGGGDTSPRGSGGVCPAPGAGGSGRANGWRGWSHQGGGGFSNSLQTGSKSRWLQATSCEHHTSADELNSPAFPGGPNPAWTPQQPKANGSRLSILRREDGGSQGELSLVHPRIIIPKTSMHHAPRRATHTETPSPALLPRDPTKLIMLEQGAGWAPLTWRCGGRCPRGAGWVLRGPWVSRPHSGCRFKLWLLIFVIGFIIPIKRKSPGL